jgi:hypothetical protein
MQNGRISMQTPIWIIGQKVSQTCVLEYNVGMENEREGFQKCFI